MAKPIFFNQIHRASKDISSAFTKRSDENKALDHF